MHRRKQNAIGSPFAKEFRSGTAFLESWLVARSLKETIPSKCRGMLPKRCRRENVGADDAMVLPMLRADKAPLRNPGAPSKAASRYPIRT